MSAIHVSLSHLGRPCLAFCNIGARGSAKYFPLEENSIAVSLHPTAIPWTPRNKDTILSRCQNLTKLGPYCRCAPKGGPGFQGDLNFTGHGENHVDAASSRYFDEYIVGALRDNRGEFRQVVLLTGPDDVRPYRLPAPAGTLYFQVASPAYSVTKARLKEAKVRVPKGCLSKYVPADLASGDDWRDEGWGEKVVRMGYRGDRPSIWLLQGVEGLSEQGLQSILGHASSLAMNGSPFIGELPLSALAVSSREEGAQRLVSAFARCGFLAEIVQPSGAQETCSGIAFVAYQQRLSEAQMEKASNEITLAEEGGDEMGFEDIP